MSCFGLAINKKVSFFGKNITNIPKKEERTMLESNQQKMIVEGLKEEMIGEEEEKKIGGDFVVMGVSGEQREYRQQIFSYLMSNQQRQNQQCSPNISNYMRQILIDWLVQLHQHFSLNQQTLYLALAYLNAVEAKHHVQLQQYQLIGSTCLWMAAKYEEIHPPELNKFCETTKWTYSIDQFITMEAFILDILSFNLNIVTPLEMLQMVGERLLAKMDKCGPKQKKKIISLWKYILQIILSCGIGKEYCMFTLVIASFELTMNKLYPNHSKQQSMHIQSEMLLSCLSRIKQTISSYGQHNLRSLSKKYNKEKYAFVGRMFSSIKHA